MTKDEFQSFIEEYKFFEAGEIIFENGRFNFTFSDVNNHKGFVYLWVELSGSAYSIVYVGKAGKTLKSRFSQHKGGFHGGSVTGEKNASLIREGLNLGKLYLVFARKSPLIEMVDELVPSESAEELAFIKKLGANLWNRA